MFIKASDANYLGLFKEVFFRILFSARPNPKVARPEIVKAAPRLLLSRPVFGTENVAVTGGSVGVMVTVGLGVVVAGSVGVG